MRNDPMYHSDYQQFCVFLNQSFSQELKVKAGLSVTQDGLP
jgi:hypothetical protein